MSLFAQVASQVRFASGLRGFLGHTLTLDEARAIVKRRLEQREANFLRLLEEGIYRHRRSPYLALLAQAQAELGDIRNLLRDRGLEGTLRALRAAGVYVTFEELKGRRPIVRQGRVIEARPADFDNPYIKNTFRAESSGSTGAGSQMAHDLAHLAAYAVYYLLTFAAQEVLDAPTALWRGILPDGSGLGNILRGARFGRPAQRWFSQIDPRTLRSPAKYVLATYFTVAAARLWGAAIPWPQTVRLEEAIVVARWAAEALRAHGRCLIITTVSRGLRVALAAQEAGLNLAGATFMIAGEPVTPAKVKAITASGARCFATYGLTEIGRLGMGCANPADATDVHLLRDACAVIQHPREVPGTTTSVPAFNITSLLLTAPKLVVNAESDDFGIIEARSCGCALEACGYPEHIRDVFSFGKLTGEGVTLIGSDMVRILEEALPARFGGSPLDYQLLEEEDAEGFTRLSLVVSPRVFLPDENAAVELVEQALRRSSVSADVAGSTWRQAGALRVKRMDPVWTGRGKLMPLFAARRAGPDGGSQA